MKGCCWWKPPIQAAQLNIINAALFADYRNLEDKTVLDRLPARRFRLLKGNTLMATEIFFDEPTLLQTKQPAVGVLRNFTARVRALIEGMPGLHVAWLRRPFRR